MKLSIPVQKKPPTIVFCFPGRSFSGDFLQNWSEVLLSCVRNGITPMLSQKYDPVVYYVRNKCLGGDVRRGVHQKPFDGKIPYDYLMWVDSDILFTFDQMVSLLKHDLPIVSGVYMKSDKVHYATVKTWDTSRFTADGSFEFLRPETIGDKPLEVDYTGFGFILIKAGVLESLEYPWFQPVMHDLGNGIKDFSSEDVSACLAFKNKGYKIVVDPNVRVGHEKVQVL